MSDTNSNRFDAHLRGKAGHYRKEPAGRVWEKLQADLPKTTPQKNYRLAGFILLGILLMLLGNLLPRISAFTQWNTPDLGTGDHRETAISGRFGRVNQPSPRDARAEANKLPAAVPATVPTPESSRESQLNSSPQIYRIPKQTRQPQTLQFNKPAVTKEESNQPAAGPAQEGATTIPALFAAVKSEGNAEEKSNRETNVPGIFQALLNSEQEVQKQVVTASPEAAENTALIKAMQAQKQELQKLQYRADSLLALYLPEPAENYASPSVPDSVPRTMPEHRWSAALTVAPELNFMHLSAPATDTLLEMRRNHESGRAGASAAISLEYQISKKLRLGAGIGYSTYGAELRITNTQTLLNVRYDTTTQITTQHYTNTHTNYIVQQDSTAVMDPVFNQNGQVIGYNTVYVPHPDTTWHTVVVEGTDTVRTQTITPLIHQTRKTNYRKLKPQYHFVTLPVMLYYKITPGKRWWAEVGAGGQLQLFRGGTQLVTEDGRTYHTEKVGPNEGPFRPVNLALMGNLSLNYGLSERLSLSMAPAVRWQVQSVYKKETGLKQKPLATGVQFGLRFRL